MVHGPWCHGMADWSTTMSRIDPRNCFASNLMPSRTSSGIQRPLQGALERKIPPLGMLIAPRTERSYYRRPYVIKNQRGASKIPPNGGILRSKAPSRGLWMPELVLYGIRLLAKQFLGTVLDIEVDHSVKYILIKKYKIIFNVAVRPRALHRVQ